MGQENYDGLLWDIGDIPIGSSTPDDLFELSYSAEASCPNCGSKISGTANYWSKDDGVGASWLHNISYEPCECEDDEDLDDINF